jgi:hypothetical protein
MYNQISFTLLEMFVFPYPNGSLHIEFMSRGFWCVTRLTNSSLQLNFLSFFFSDQAFYTFIHTVVKSTLMTHTLLAPLLLVTDMKNKSSWEISHDD